MPAITSIGEPQQKRIKQHQERTQDSENPASTGSRIFVPFRTIGLVSSTSVPFTVASAGSTAFYITTSVGRTLHTYDVSRGLGLLSVTRPPTPHDITATVAWKGQLYAAWFDHVSSERAGIWVFERGKKVGELRLPDGTGEPVQEIIALGAWIVACCITRIEVWNSVTHAHHTSIYRVYRPRNTSAGFLSGTICSLPTYLNKIFVGTEEGSVEVYNVSTGKLVHTIEPVVSKSGPVTALEPAPALHLLAIAWADGSLVLHDVRRNKHVLEVCHGSSDVYPVSSIAFRSDGHGAGLDGARAGVMVTSSSTNNDITVWDLNGGGQVIGTLRSAHDYLHIDHSRPPRGVNKVEFLTGQAVLTSCGYDNSLKTWIFDDNPYSAVPRPLHNRRGHARPATCLNFVAESTDGSESTGKWLLSSGQDQMLWGWSLRKDAQSTELSQGNIGSTAAKHGLRRSRNPVSRSETPIDHLRVSEITSMAVSLNRDGGMGGAAGIKSAIWKDPFTSNGISGSSRKDGIGLGQLTSWESIVTGHRNDRFARTWFWGRKRAGRWALPTSDRSPVSTVAITICGTFAVIGGSEGSVDLYNLQSGQHRRTFPSTGPSKVIQSSAVHLRHKDPVIGLVADSMNRTLISCDQAGMVRFWDFRNGKPLGDLNYSHARGVSCVRFHRPTQLLALACMDTSIRLIDSETRRLVRQLSPSRAPINDFCFSQDGRWILAANQDSIIRVWDLPTGHLIDRFQLDEPAVALSISDTGEFLATASAASLGVEIWSNRALFSKVPLHRLDETTFSAYQSIIQSLGRRIEGSVMSEGDGTIHGKNNETRSLAQSGLPSKTMITLSLVPKSRWQTLLNLDLIRERNKPKDPPKKPEKAPFFLPSLLDTAASLSRDVQGSDQRVSRDDQLPTRFLAGGTRDLASDLSKVLDKSALNGDFAQAVKYLKGLSPSAADTEIRKLDLLAPCLEVCQFIEALCWQLRQREDFELVQTWMSVFLSIHGSELKVSTATDTQDSTAGEFSTLSSESEGRERVYMKLKDWKRLHDAEAARIKSLVSFCSGVLGFIQSTR